MRATPGWTLTDHADRLDEHHHNRRLDSGTELALDLSYRHLPTDQQRLLRLAALHPGQDLDAYAAAALADTDLRTTRTHLHHLCRDHLLQPGTPGRYTLHDLVRAYAAGRAGDEDSPPQRRAALTRLFDYYLATAAAAVTTLHPVQAHRRPRIPPAGTPAPALANLDAARAWLDTERPSLVSVAAYTATQGWPTHTTRLSAILFRYLAGGHVTDALTIHGHAHDAAQHVGDPSEQADALASLAVAHLLLGRHGPAAEHLQHALHLFRQAGDAAGQARALNNLGLTEIRLGRHGSATKHLQQALTLFRELGNRTGEAWALDSIGFLHTHLDQPTRAADYYQRALAIFRQIGARDGEACTLNGLGETAHTTGRPTDAITHHTAAHTIAAHIDDREQQARAHTGLGHAHHTLANHTRARHHYQHALTIYTNLGMPEADQIGTHLTTIDNGEAAPHLGYRS
jgi:tetratricopeptide (TPR) repeat protein